MTTVSLVTGANRGIGLDVVRQLAERGHTVYLGSRDHDAGAAAAEVLTAAGLAVRPITLDITDPTSIDAAATRIGSEQGRLDVLVNNAAIHYDTWQNAIHADLVTVAEAFDTNVVGTWRITQALIPLLQRSQQPRIVNVSSGAGSLTDMGGGVPAYRLTKAAVNALTRMLAAELTRPRILVNSVCPGWVATDMGGPGGRPVADGAAGIVWAATLANDGPTGGFFRDRQPIPW